MIAVVRHSGGNPDRRAGMAGNVRSEGRTRVVYVTPVMFICQQTTVRRSQMSMVKDVWMDQNHASVTTMLLFRSAIVFTFAGSSRRKIQVFSDKLPTRNTSASVTARRSSFTVHHHDDEVADPLFT